MAGPAQRTTARKASGDAHQHQAGACCAQAPAARFVRMFKPRFARLVETGEKLQTIRPMPKRLPEIGDHLSLREWTGKPYRSKQRTLCEAIVIHVARITIHEGHYWHALDSVTRP
jgi:hypothetical protein